MDYNVLVVSSSSVICIIQFFHVIAHVFMVIPFPYSNLVFIFLLQTSKLIQEQGSVLSEGLKTLQEEKEAEEENEEQKTAHLQKEEEYRTMFLQIREKVKNLIKEASDLVAKLHFHRSAISGLATSVEGRYKDLAQNIKQYRDSLESKLQTTLPEFEVISFCFYVICFVDLPKYFASKMVASLPASIYFLFSLVNP